MDPSAIALIPRAQDGPARWLTRWNPSSRAFSFVGGPLDQKETARNCCIRKICDVLGLVPDADFVVADSPQSQLEYTAWAEGARGETTVTIALFPVTLVGDFAEEKIAGDANNRWLGQTEIQSGFCNDGRPVAATLALLLQMAGLFDES